MTDFNEDNKAEYGSKEFLEYHELLEKTLRSINAACFGGFMTKEKRYNKIHTILTKFKSRDK